MGHVNQICEGTCGEFEAVRGQGVLNCFVFCCKKGLETIRERIKKKYNLKES